MKNLSKKLFLVVFMFALIFSNVGYVLAVTIGTPSLVSKSTLNDFSNAPSSSSNVSTDGRYVVFRSDASNLLSGDTNGVSDVFVRDTQLNTTTRVSVSTAGVESNALSSGIPAISYDGRYVVFGSYASNLVSGDTNGVPDAFVRDTQLNTTTRVSVSTAGLQSNADTYGNYLVSSDGRYIGFNSQASNLVAGDSNGRVDAFVRDTQLNTTTRVSVSTASTEADSQSNLSHMSSDGRYMVFNSDATNLVSGDTNGLYDVFVRDTQLNTTTRVSVSTAGIESDAGSYASYVSSDGRYIAFGSEASTLVSGDTNGVQDIFVRDTQLNTTTRVSVSTLSVEGNNESQESSISSDGRYVVFRSDASNLVSGDTNGVSDVFVRDTQLNTTTRASVDISNSEGDGESIEPTISYDGNNVVFLSYATNLVSGDLNNVNDIFIVPISTSPPISTPTTTTTSASSITTTTAVLTGNITDTGGEANNERGFDIGTDNTYTMSDVEDVTGSYSTGSYSLTATGLTCGTMYYYRAYSTNTSGTGTGSDSTFTTSACPSSRSSTSASARATNLINMGKVQEAQEIINQFPTQTQNVNTNTNPTAPKPTNTPTVRKGNRNNEVKYIQEYLKIKADGIFGPITQKAVIEFQKKNNLVPDGVVGPMTWGEMK